MGTIRPYLLIMLLFVIFGCNNLAAPQGPGGQGRSEEYDSGVEEFNCAARGRFFENRSMDCDVARMREEALSKIDKRDCRKKGGTIRGVGMFGLPTCVIPFSDGGTPCSDNSECQGNCTIYDERKPDSMRDTASCEFNNDWNACYATVVGGVDQGVQCWE